jgi:hypothetical protein
MSPALVLGSKAGFSLKVYIYVLPIVGQLWVFNPGLRPGFTMQPSGSRLRQTSLKTCPQWGGVGSTPKPSRNLTPKTWGHLHLMLKGSSGPFARARS